MKSRTLYSAIALVAGVLLLLGSIGFWGLTAQNPRALLAKGGQEIPEAAQFVPRQAPLMVSLLARPDRLWQLRQLLASPGQRFVARQEWQSLQATLTEALGWDYDRDLRPWLDQEVAIAVTTADLDHDLDNGLQAGYLAVLSCLDGQKARESLHLLWQNRALAGRNLVFETVSGVPLIYDQSPSPAFSSVRGLNQSALRIEQLASAIIGDRYVLLANHPQVLRQAIATFQAPDVSLARASTYREAIQALPAKRISWLYANVPSFFSWLGLEDEPLKPLTESGHRAKALFISFQAFSSGLLGNTAITAAPGTAFSAHAPGSDQAEAAIDLLPGDTLFALSGANLSQFLAEVTETMGGYRVGQRSLQALATALPLPSGTIPSQLLDSAQSEYALGLLPGSPTTWALVMQSNSADSFNEIDELATQQGLSVSQVTFEGRDLTIWSQLFLTRTRANSPASLTTQVVGVHTQLNGYEVLASSLEGLEQILQRDRAGQLSETPAFLQLTDSLNTENGSLAYVDWPRLAPALLNRVPWLRILNQAGHPLTAHLGPILLKSKGNSPSLQEGTLVIKLLENP